MKNKQLFSILIVVVLLLALLAGCGTSDPTTPGLTGQADAQESGSANTDATPQHTQAAAAPKRPLNERFIDVQAEVLAVTVVPFDEACINGYLMNETEYETATILTVGLTFADWDTLYEFGSATLLNTDGVEVKQTWASTAWDNHLWTPAPEINYAVIVYRMPGEIDPAGFGLRLKERYGKTTANIRLADNGNVNGFVGAEAAMPENIVRLQGREYMITKQGVWSNHLSSETRSIILVPLEGGFGKSLDASRIFLNAPENADFDCSIHVNDPEYAENTVDANLEESIDVFVSKKDESSEAKIDPFFDEISAEIDDGSGNAVIVSLKTD